MPEINSFCVIVTQQDEVLFWSRPIDLDNAKRIFNGKCKNPTGDVVLEAPKPYQQFSLLPDDNHIEQDSNKGIERMIKNWGGDTAMVRRAYEVELRAYTHFRTGIKVMLKHSRIT